MMAHSLCWGTTISQSPCTSSQPTPHHSVATTRHLHLQFRQPTKQQQPQGPACWSPGSRTTCALNSLAAAAGPGPGSPCALPSPAASPFLIRPLTASDLPCIKRLHKFCKYQGQPVFGSDLSAVDDMLEHAASGASGALGLVICSSDDGSELVGGVTAQVEEAQARRQQGEGASGSGAAAGAAAAVALVLLSVVVRADQRQLGAGRALLLALQDHAARALGASCIMTDVAAANKPAIDFFSRLGYTTSSSDGPRSKTLEFTLDLREARE